MRCHQTECVAASSQQSRMLNRDHYSRYQNNQFRHHPFRFCAENSMLCYLIMTGSEISSIDIAGAINDV